MFPTRRTYLASSWPTLNTFRFSFKKRKSFIHTTLKGETMTCFFRVYLVQGKCQRPREMSNVLLTVCPSCLYAKINFLFPKLKRKCFFHFRNFSKTESSSHQSPCLTMVTTVKNFFDSLFTCCSSLENFSKHTSSWSCPTFLRHPSKVISISISIFLSPSEPFSVLQGWWLPCLASDPLTLLSILLVCDQTLAKTRRYSRFSKIFIAFPKFLEIPRKCLFF